MYDWDNSNLLEAGETSEPNVSSQKNESLIRTYSRRKMHSQSRYFSLSWLYENMFGSWFLGLIPVQDKDLSVFYTIKCQHWRGINESRL